jgi:hypothetical protein
MNIKSVIESAIEFFKEYGEVLLVLSIPIVFFISLGILICYDKPDPRYKTNADNSNITIHTVDNHEYLVYQYDRAGGICHKVDCKFCVAKNGKD